MSKLFFFIAVVLFNTLGYAQTITLKAGTNLKFAIKITGESDTLNFAINYFGDSVSYQKLYKNYRTIKKGSPKGMEVTISENMVYNSLRYWVDFDEWIGQYDDAEILNETPGLWASRRTYGYELAQLNSKKKPTYLVTNATYKCKVKGKIANLKCLKIVTKWLAGEEGPAYETYILKDENNPLLLKSTNYTQTKSGTRIAGNSYALIAID